MKQILQYLWIEKYGCIENQEFNFTNRIQFHYDQKKQMITVKENDDYYTNFFGMNIELTCVVGQNGTGKTSLLRAIKKVFAKEYGGVDLNCIAIFFNQEDGKYTGWYFLANGNNKKHSITTDYKNLELNNHEDKKQYNGKTLIENYQSNIVKNCEHFGNYKARYIYLSEPLVQSLYTLPMGNDELSTSYLLYDERIGELGDHVNRFFLKEFEKQIDLIINYDCLIEKFKIRYTPFVKASLLDDKRIWDDYVDGYGEDEEHLDSVYSCFLRQDNFKYGVEYFKDKLAEAMFLNIIITFSRVEPKLSRYEFKKLIGMIENSSYSSAWDNFRCFICGRDIEKSEIFFHNLTEYRNFIEYIDKECVFSKRKNAFVPLKLSGLFLIPTQSNINIEADLETDIKEFFMHYKKAADFHSFINFSWNLSSGEASLLNIFARLNSVLKTRYLPDGNKEQYLPEEDMDDRTEENVVLLLDEIEVSLHPEWQRNIINELLKFIQYAFTGSNVQVIMTTHSPIMLSDIPKQNVVYLSSNELEENKEQPETFGSNIFKLYNNAFFLDKGAIGAFAKEKLEKLLKEILDGKGNKVDLQRRIKLIGDDFLRERFQSQFDAIYNKTKSIDDEIKKLEEKVAKLKEIRDGMNERDQKEKENRKTYLSEEGE